jgi:hypothetical protein
MATDLPAALQNSQQNGRPILLIVVAEPRAQVCAALDRGEAVVY